MSFMKKKSVTLIIIAVILIIAIIISLFFFLNPKSGKKDDTSNPYDDRSVGEWLLEIDNLESLNNIVKENDLRMEYDSETEEYSVFEVECFERESQYVFIFDDEGKIDYRGVYFTLFGYVDESKEDSELVEFTPLELKESTLEILENLQNFLGVQYAENYYILSDAGVLDSTDDSFEEIKEGRAFLEFSVIDQDGTLWMMQVTCSNGIALCLIEHNLDKDSYVDFIPNVYVE